MLLKRRYKAFSLVELMLYLALLSVIVLAITSFLGSISEVSQKSYAINTVNSEAGFILNTLGQQIRKASTVNSPAAGSNLATLSLATTDNTNPITVYSSSEKLYLKEAGGTAIDLTSSQVRVTGLNFINTGVTGTSGAVRIELTLAFKNTSGRNSQNYQQTFYDTVTIRK